MRAKDVKAVIYSARITPEFKAAKDMHNKQYPDLELKTMRTIHDRFCLWMIRFITLEPRSRTWVTK